MMNTENKNRMPIALTSYYVKIMCLLYKNVSSALGRMNSG